MPHTKLATDNNAISIETDKNYTVTWQLQLEGDGVFALPGRKAKIAAAKLSTTKISLSGQIIRTEKKSADLLFWESLMPLLAELETNTTCELTLEVGDGSIVCTGWVSNLLHDRFVESNTYVIDISFDFWLQFPANLDGISSHVTDSFSYSNTRLTVDGDTIYLEGDRKLSVDWNLQLEGKGVYPKPNRRTVLSAGQLSTTKVSTSGEIIKTSNNAPDVILWALILPALSKFHTSQTGNLIYDTGIESLGQTDQIDFSGWCTFFEASRDFPDGEEQISYSLDFWLDQKPDISGLS